jgi:hypothetical protein
MVTHKQLEESQARRVRTPSMTPLEDVEKADRIIELIAAFDAEARSNDRPEVRKKLVTVLANIIPSDSLLLLSRGLEQLRGIAGMPDIRYACPLCGDPRCLGPEKCPSRLA